MTQMSFHKREARPAWWAIFDRAVAEIDEMELDPSDILLNSISYGRVGRSVIPETDIDQRGLG